MVVTKGHDPQVIRQAAVLGIADFGENYVQEWKEKQSELSDLDIRWHFIGHLQTNKVKLIVGRVETIQSVDRLSLAKEISRRAGEQKVTQKIYLEVNVAGEKSKSGVAPENAPALLEAISKLPWLNLQGLMVMPPLVQKADRARPYFAQARNWLNEWRTHIKGRHDWKELSMGTSVDYVVALEEGSTLIRLGSAILGPRKERKQ